MKVCVVGLGAVGGLIAAWLGSRLHPGEIQLSALARGATLEAVRHNGLRLQSRPAVSGTEQSEVEADITVLLHASDDPAQLGQQDLVVLAVKAHALPAVAPAVARLCGPQTQIVAALNGVPWWFFDGLPGPANGLVVQAVDPGGTVRALLPGGRVIGAVVHLASSTTAPGRVCHGQGNALILGRPGGAVDPGLRLIGTLLSAAGFDVSLSERIQRDVWFKLWGNMTMNPVSALTGATLDRMLDDRLVRNFCSAVMREAAVLGDALGIHVDQTPDQRHAVARKLGAVRTSMLQDVEAGRPLEIDALIGAVHEIGVHMGIATPNVDALFGLVRLMAAERGLLPEVT